MDIEPLVPTLAVSVVVGANVVDFTVVEGSCDGFPRVVDITNGEDGLDVVPRVVVDITSVEVGLFVCAMVEGIAEEVLGYRKTAGTTVVESVDVRA